MFGSDPRVKTLDMPTNPNKKMEECDQSHLRTRIFLILLGASENYRKSMLSLRISLLGRLHDLQYIFALIYGIRFFSGGEYKFSGKKNSYVL